MAYFKTRESLVPLANSPDFAGGCLIVHQHTCATSVMPSLTRGQSLRMNPYKRNLCKELRATPVIGPVVAGDSTTARKGRRYLQDSIRVSWVLEMPLQLATLRRVASLSATIIV